MNIRVLRKLAWFALPVMGLFVSCGEDDDTSWKDQLQKMEERLAANDGEITSLKSQIKTGDYVTDVKLEGSKLIATTEGGETFEIEVAAEAAEVSVVPTLDPATGVLTITTTCGDEAPVAKTVDLPAEASAPTIKLEGNTLTVGDATVEIPAAAAAADAELVVEGGKVYVVYMDGDTEVKEEVQTPESIPSYTLGMADGVVTLYAGTTPVEGSSFSIKDVVGDATPYVAVGLDGVNYTITLTDEEGNVVTEDSWPAVPVSLTGLELVPTYVNSQGTPIESAVNPYIYYTPVGEETPEILGAKQTTYYRANPYRIALEQDGVALMQTLAPGFIVSDKDNVWSAVGEGESDAHAQLEVVSVAYDEATSILSVVHQFDHENPQNYNSESYDEFWQTYYVESDEMTFNAALKVNNPYKTGDASVVATEDHGLLKTPYLTPMIVSNVTAADSDESQYGSLGYQNRGSETTPDDSQDWQGRENLPAAAVQEAKDLIADFDPSAIDGADDELGDYYDQEDQSYDWDLFMDNVDYVISAEAETTQDLNEWVKAIALRDRGDEVEVHDFDGPVLNLENGSDKDYDFVFTFVNADGEEVDSDEYFTLVDDVLSPKSSILSPWNKAFIRVKLMDVEDDDKYVMDYMDFTVLAFPYPTPHPVSLVSSPTMLALCPVLGDDNTLVRDLTLTSDVHYDAIFSWMDYDYQITEGPYIMHTVSQDSENAASTQVNFDPVYTQLGLTAEEFFEYYAEVYNNTVVEFGVKGGSVEAGTRIKLERHFDNYTENWFDLHPDIKASDAIQYCGFYEGSFVLVTIAKQKASDNTCSYQNITVEVEEDLASRLSEGVENCSYVIDPMEYDLTMDFVHRTTFDQVNLDMPVDFSRDYTALAPKRGIYWTSDYTPSNDCLTEMARFNGNLDFVATNGAKSFVFENRPVDAYMTGGKTAEDNSDAAFADWSDLYQGLYSCLEYNVVFPNGTEIPFYSADVASDAPDAEDNVIEIDEIKALYGIDQRFFYPYVGAGRYENITEANGNLNQSYEFDFVVTDPISGENYHFEDVEYFFQDPFGEITVNDGAVYEMEEDDQETCYSLAGLVSIKDREDHDILISTRNATTGLTGDYDNTLYFDEDWSPWFLDQGEEVDVDSFDADDIYNGDDRLIRFSFAENQDDPNALALIAKNDGSDHGALYFNVWNDDASKNAPYEICYDSGIMGVDKVVTVKVDVLIYHRWSDTWGPITNSLTVTVSPNK